MSSSGSANSSSAGLEIGDTAQTFWDRIYASKTKASGGRPSSVLTRFTAGRPKGRALDLGCARGDDAIWLAQQGWKATGVDVSEAAVEAARLAAAAQGVAADVSFERHDLTHSFPEGRFDLVTAMFLQSPVPFDRTKVLRRAAHAVEREGLLLLVTHGSRAPWSWSAPEALFPTAEAELADLALDPEAWRDMFVGTLPRMAFGPAGEQATLLDTIVALERR